MITRICNTTWEALLVTINDAETAESVTKTLAEGRGDTVGD